MTWSPPHRIGHEQPSRTVLRRGGRTAFTLIELIISTALTAVVLAGAYACLRAGVSSQRVVEPRTELLQTARVVLALISADLRCATSFPKGPALLGTRKQLENSRADVLDFATRNHTPRQTGEGDFCEMSLFVERNPQTGTLSLFRRRNPRLAFDPLSGGSREELASEVTAFELEYYDGLNWYDSWGDPQAGSLKSQMATPKPNESGLPTAVRITLALDPNPSVSQTESATPDKSPTPLTFQTVVMINVTQASGSTGSTTSTSSDSSSENPAATPALSP